MAKPAWSPCFSAYSHLDKMAFVGAYFSRTFAILDQGNLYGISWGLDTIWLLFQHFLEHFTDSPSFFPFALLHDL